MKRNNFKKYYILSGIFFTLFVILTILVKYVDVQPIGPEDSLVGFATLNKYFLSLFTPNLTLFYVTDYLVFVGIIIAVIFAVIGIIQLIKRKSIKRVDSDLIILGVYYIFVVIFYLFFEFEVINFRPILIDGKLQASYPSTTSFVLTSVIPVAIVLYHKMISNKPLRITIDVVLILVDVFAIVGRLVSCGHWFTDILGSLVLSAGFVFIFLGVKRHVDTYKQIHRNNY
ncbi:MAG: phosphoesterase PA-phosphatase [Bacilli bacterium]